MGAISSASSACRPINISGREGRGDEVDVGVDGWRGGSGVFEEGMVVGLEEWLPGWGWEICCLCGDRIGVGFGGLVLKYWGKMLASF